MKEDGKVEVEESKGKKTVKSSRKGKGKSRMIIDSDDIEIGSDNAEGKHSII